MTVVQVAPAPVTCDGQFENKINHGIDKGVNLEWHSSGLQKGENKLYRTLRPMFVTMKIFGMYYLDDTTFKNSLLSKFSFGYSVFVLIVLIGNLCINLPTFFTLNSLDHIIFRGSLFVWYTYTTCQAIAMFMMCFKVSSWRQLFKMYEQVEDTIWNIEGHIHLKKRVYVYVIVCWAVIICDISGTAYLLFNSEVFNYQYIFTLGEKQPVEISILKGLFIFINVYLNAAWIVPVVLSVMMNDLLAMNFRCFNEKVVKSTKICPMNLSSALGEIRDMHQRLTDITNTADTLFSPIAAMVIIFNVIINCCILYIMIYNILNSMNPVTLILQLFWLTSSLLVIFVNTGTCAWLKKEAHGSLEILLSMKVKQVTEEFSLQMNMFLARLTGSYIGITAGGMFVIDKNTVLTVVGMLITSFMVHFTLQAVGMLITKLMVVGMLITYFILLIQFKTAPPVCDCTSALANLTLQCVLPNANLTI